MCVAQTMRFSGGMLVEAEILSLTAWVSGVGIPSVSRLTMAKVVLLSVKTRAFA